MFLRALAILFSLSAHVAFGYALWFRPQSDELDVLDVGRGREITLTPAGTAVRAASVTDHAESIQSEQAPTIGQKQPAPPGLLPGGILPEVVGAVATGKSQNVAAVEDQKPLSKAMAAAVPEGLPDVIGSENSTVAQAKTAAELPSELPADEKTEERALSTAQTVQSGPPRFGRR